MVVQGLLYGTTANRTASGPTSNVHGLELMQASKDVLVALDHLHSNNLMHCDVKPANILVMPPRDSKSLRLAICDLGHSIAGVAQSKQFNFQQTPLYRAPEVAMHLALTPAADVWSTGLVLVEMWSYREGDGHGEWHTGPLMRAKDWMLQAGMNFEKASHNTVLLAMIKSRFGHPNKRWFESLEGCAKQAAGAFWRSTAEPMLVTIQHIPIEHPCSHPKQFSKLLLQWEPSRRSTAKDVLCSDLFEKH